MPDLSPWILPGLSALGVLLAALSVALRRAALRETALGLSERADAVARGSHTARLQHPHIDVDQCIGCGSCVRACPEEGVLAMVHGQAAVVHGARCVGHGLCADACPVGAVAVTLGDVRERDDLPALTSELEAATVPDLYIAGELTGFALVRTAIAHGTAVADAVARRVPQTVSRPTRIDDGNVAVAEREPLLDLLVVGAGPGGLACALRAKELSVGCTVLEQELHIGGAVASYPRAKLVMTQPVHLPLHGKLPRLSYAKEELVEIWQEVVARHELDVRTGVRLLGVERIDDGFVARTNRGEIRARNVCLALGRRGTPRKLGVAGEELAKVSYGLLDAQSWSDSRILVVGGGDSAIEAALGLAAQPGNEVTLSYRRHAFSRLKARNDAAIRAAEADGSIQVLYETVVREITDDAVVLAGVDGAGHPLRIHNDAVFVLAGGEPPFALLRDAGVSFDASDRAAPAAPEIDRGTGLLLGLIFAGIVALGLLGVTILFGDYYGLSLAERTSSPRHAALQPKGSVGLTFGLLAGFLFLCNLAYLLRRSPRLGRWLPGSLRAWMGAHVFTGLAAFFCVLLHSALAPRQSVGGHAFWTLVVVVVTGTIGRYLYAFVPRATNGKELELDELRQRVAALSSEWDRDGHGFGASVRTRVEALLTSDRSAWQRGFVGRVLAVLRSRLELERALRPLRRAGLADGVPEREVLAMVGLARRAHRLMLASAHFAEVRAILGSWRYLHRWLALLMLLLTVLHVITAVRYAHVDWSVVPLLGDIGGAR